MFNWLLDLIPAWMLVLAAVVVAIVAWRLLGLRGLLAAITAIITAGAYRAGRTQGAEAATERQRKANQKAVKDHADIRAETGRMSDAELDARNDPWVRKRR